MNLKNYSQVHHLTAIAFILALALVPSAHPANIWDGSGADGFWNTAANWDNETVPSASQNLTFSGNVQTITTNNITSFTVGATTASTYAITFGNTGALGTSAFTLAGNQITLNCWNGRRFWFYHLVRCHCRVDHRHDQPQHEYCYHCHYFPRR